MMIIQFHSDDKIFLLTFLMTCGILEIKGVYLMFNFETYCLEWEFWKDIPEYEGIYQASSLGRIRSIDGKTTESVRHGVRVWKGKILKNKTKTPSESGYKVTLWKNKKPLDLLVARLICMTFHGVPKNMSNKDVKLKMTVNHKDGNRLNNNIENIEWLTLAENIKHGFENDLYYQVKVLLVNKETQQSHIFRSMSQASKFLGKANGYLSNQIKKKHKIYGKNKEEYISIDGLN